MTLELLQRSAVARARYYYLSGPRLGYELSESTQDP